MFRRTFKVTFYSVKNNFVLLPQKYFDLVSTYDNGCLTMTYGNTCHCASWLPYGGRIMETDIGINAKVAKEIGLKENDLVKVALVQDTLNLTTVFVTPVTSRDWDIIELSSEKIEATVLEQIRIINTTEIFVIWVNKSMSVLLSVDRVKPKTSFGRIDNSTELIVKPNIHQQKFNSIATTNTKKNYCKSIADIQEDDDILNPSSSILRSKTISEIPSIQSSSLSKSTTLSDIRAQQQYHHHSNILSRSSSNSTTTSNSNSSGSNRIINRIERLERLIKDLKKENKRNFEFRCISGGKWSTDTFQISDIFVTKNNLPEYMDLDQVYVLNTIDDKEYYVNVKVVAENDTFPNNIHQTIEINENLMKLLKIKELEKIILQPKSTIINFVEKIELFSNKKINYKLLETAFKKYVIERTKLTNLLLNQDQILKLEDDIIVTVHITPHHFKYCLLDIQILKEAKIYAADEIRNVDDLLDIEQNEERILSVKDLIKIKKFDDIVNDIVDQFKMNLCLDQTNSILQQGNILVTGSQNSGKTVLIERIIDELSQKPYCCFYDIFYCTRSKGRKVESIQKDLRQVFIESLKKAPSIVILENIDVLARTVGEQQTQESEYYNRISDIIQHLIIEYTATNPIAVISTVSRIQNLNTRLHVSRGRHIFHQVVKIPELEREDREIILKELCSHLDNDNIDLQKFSNLTEGYNFGDLVQLVERAIFYAYRINPNLPLLNGELLQKSLENTNSYCLQGIKSHYRTKNCDDSQLLMIEDIPGMENVVNVLEEVIKWPSEYSAIFEDSPLRNQAGVLLFGPPGTGKTFLVSQMSYSWNLRMISVKGPELLAKYIGQSEENVRKLFNKARNAKPCILFFDEFDSLAPKRGHDSTGVTDRVVNQLLTELDGVEGLHGVTVIAATSRPELLDPALLRSGRIDRLIECELPNRDARKRIFTVLSKSLHLDKTVNFDYLAEKTENFTGADIQSILTTANMTAIKDVLKQCNPENLPDKITLTQNHLIDALNNTRPSLSPNDILRYHKTYARFTNKEKQSRDFVAKRATLA